MCDCQAIKYTKIMAELRFFKIYQIIITLIHVKGQEIGMKLDESTPKYLKVSWSYGLGKD